MISLYSLYSVPIFLPELNNMIWKWNWKKNETEAEIESDKDWNRMTFEYNFWILCVFLSVRRLLLFKSPSFSSVFLLFLFSLRFFSVGLHWLTFAVPFVFRILCSFINSTKLSVMQCNVHCIHSSFVYWHCMEWRSDWRQGRHEMIIVIVLIFSIRILCGLVHRTYLFHLYTHWISFLTWL